MPARSVSTVTVRKSLSGSEIVTPDISVGKPAKSVAVAKEIPLISTSGSRWTSKSMSNSVEALRPVPSEFAAAVSVKITLACDVALAPEFD